MLLASIHDVIPRFERETAVLAELLTRNLHGLRFAMLVIPDHWGEAPLSQASAFRSPSRRRRCTRAAQMHRKDAGGIWQASAGCSICRSTSLNSPVMPFLRPGRATHGSAAAE